MNGWAFDLRKQTLVVRIRQQTKKKANKTKKKTNSLSLLSGTDKWRPVSCRHLSFAPQHARQVYFLMAFATSTP
ncbi:hypothetical protein OUZ56_001585 [Daphnia magna]|uniref:Uncharacterized protein n=1 Tax=Daphnia magna TaxID=35525 RepID=A0ABR0A3N4_9CRUS|nr:hypothetical protein OUZ56_001585 [Daphnia magna]